MKIAFIYDLVWPWVRSGAEKRVYEIAKRLSERGHEVHWYGVGWWWEDNFLSDIEVDGIHLHGVCKPMEIYVNGKRSIKEAIYFALNLFPHLMKEDFDIVECQEFPYFPCFSAWIHASLGKSILIITWYEVWDEYWYEYMGKIGFIGRIIEKFTLKLPKFLIPISEKIKDDLTDLNISESKMRVVTNGVDFNRLQKIKPSDEELDIIYVGRLISHKNVDVLLKTISLVKKELGNVRCGIIGSGPEIDKLKSLNKELALEQNIKFFGFVENDNDVYSYMKSSKIFVLPSTREGFPNTILEANACGLPAIVVKHEKNAGVSVINEGSNGFVLNLSPEEIADKIIQLLMNEVELARLKRSSLDFAKEYDWELIVNEVEDVYNEAIR